MTATEQRNDVVLALRGELDAESVTEARKRLLGLQLPRGARLVLDLRELTFTDSKGIRLILLAREYALQRGAWFALADVPDQVARTLALVGLDEQLETVAHDRGS